MNVLDGQPQLGHVSMLLQSTAHALNATLWHENLCLTAASQQTLNRKPYASRQAGHILTDVTWQIKLMVLHVFFAPGALKGGVPDLIRYPSYAKTNHGSGCRDWVGACDCAPKALDPKL